IFYDFEVFKEDWLVVCKNTTLHETKIIVNDAPSLTEYYEVNKGEIWVGFNSRHYDQWILKGIVCGFNPKEINDFIIVEKKGGWQYSSLLNKIPLFNYDIMTSTHSLKQLEGFLGNNIKETTVPFDIDRKLTPGELQEVIQYCTHDVEQTMQVFMSRSEEFTSHLSLITAFKMPLKYLNKTKAQLSGIILKAHQQKHDDEFDITIPDTIRLNKYKFIDTWYRDKSNLDYKKKLDVEVAGVPHTFAWGGLHGAVPNYIGEGIFLNVDVASYYPSLMIEYNFGSRNIADPGLYKLIYDTRLKLKAEKNPMQQPYKIVLNSTYGAMKDKYNPLYDPLQANNVCVSGQLMLLDLIEKLEDHVQLIQSNTDGILVKLKRKKDLEKVKDICHEWEQRTKMVLEYDLYTKVIQKDVNNYIIVDENGKYKSKGAYVKKLNPLDYDLPIVNKAIINYFLNGITPEKTINECNDLYQFQRVVKVSNKYSKALYGDEQVNEKVLRIFASRRKSDKGIFKVKPGGNKEKIANAPERCFIENDNVKGEPVPRRLDRGWYIELAQKRINDFIS
ncbi:hypothetical protein ACV3VG_11640, partial [Clostridium perfringens]